MIKKLILLMTAFILPMVLCEGALQALQYPPDNFSPWIYSKSTGFSMAPNVRQRMITSEYTVEIETNEHGFRDDPIIESDGFRILLLGDSFTFGFGVERGFLFADLLERELQTEVINAGVPGFELIHQRRWFKENGKKLNANLVVLALYLGNDLSGNTTWQELPDGTLKNPHAVYPVRNKRTLKIKSLAGQIIYMNKLRKREQREWIPFQDYLTMTQIHLSDEDKLKYSLSKSLITELHRDVTESGADFFVFMFPYKTVVDPVARERFKNSIEDFDKFYDLERPAREMEQYLKDQEIRYFNLIPSMKQYHETIDDEPLFYFSDGHFTPAGHAFVAKQLKPTLSTLIEK